MAIGMKVLTVLACGVGALLNQASACSCLFGELCDDIEFAEVVVHAEALSRSDQVDINDDVTYTVRTLAMYKAEPGVLYPEELSFITGGNGALCGIYMEFGQEYLIDLVRDDFDGELHAVGLCGAFRPWSSVTELDLYHLEGGCEDDACGSYSYCFEFQECLVYEEDTEDEVYYCADVCDPSPCYYGETCELLPVKCPYPPCPPVAVCNTAYDPCDGSCGDFQECLIYEEGTEYEEYYCADVCDPSPCGSDEACILEPVICVRHPCPPVAVCNPDDDPCDLICSDFARCRIYMEGTEDEELYCEDFCDDSLCGDDEECFLDDSVVCVREPCPPPAACRPT